MAGNVFIYERDFVKHPVTGRTLATVSNVGGELHLDMATVLRPDEARALGQALARWGLEEHWNGDASTPTDGGDNPDGGGAAASA